MSNQENISKETKKTRRKKSQRKAQQIKLAVIMIMVSVLVLSASTFAWYQLNNTARLEGMQFTAETLGNLQIANSQTEDNVSYTVKSDSWGTSIDLGLTASGATQEYLVPVTTKDGVEFYSPTYDDTGKVVDDVNEITSDLDKYVYKKVFYLRVGEEGNTSTNKKFALKLDSGDFTKNPYTGTYIVDKESSNSTAANAIRISFSFKEDTDVNIKGTKIYEPNSSGDNNATADNYASTGSSISSIYGVYETIAQNENGKFLKDDDTEIDTTLYTMTESVPVQVTMYVWIEGTDDDCTSDIALDTVMGQIQFVAEQDS